MEDLAKKFLKEEKVYDFTSNEYGLTEDEFDFIFDKLETEETYGPVSEGGAYEDEDYKLIKSILHKAKQHGWKSWGERHHE